MPVSAVRPSATRRSRLLRLKALSLIIGLTAGWGIGEGAAFVAEPQLAQTFQYDPELGFRIKPYTHGSNRFGFNDRDYPLSKASGVTRVLFVGDSFGWSGGLEGNYTARVERLFASALGPGRVEVVNTGYLMTHTGEQLASLQRDGMQYQPDLVVLGFFAGNDFVDADPGRRRLALMDTYFDIPANDIRATWFDRPLLARSRLLPLIRQRSALLQQWLAGAQPGTAAGMSREAYMAMAGGQMHFYDRRKHQSGEFSRHVAYVLESVDRMDALVASRGGRFAATIYPADFTVSLARAAAIQAHHGMDPQHYDRRLAQGILIRHLEARGIPYLDLEPLFTSRSEREELYLPLDGHWNDAGNEAAARAIYDWLVPMLGSVGAPSGAHPASATR